MNFQVPQFTEIEDKIFGPLTFKQFLFVAGGAGLGYFFYILTFIPFFIRIIPVLLAIGGGLALAFYKINGRPLINAVESAFWYYVRGRLYLWKKAEPAAKKVVTVPTSTPVINVDKLSASKLKDLSWSLDVNERIK